MPIPIKRVRPKQKSGNAHIKRKYKKGAGRPSGWNPKQRQFVEEYMIDRNATQAAARAGYSKKSAKYLGQILLNYPHIEAEVARLTEIKSKQLELTADRVLKELARVAFGTLGDFMDIDEIGEPQLTFKRAGPDQLAALNEVTQEVYTEGRGENAERVKRTKIKMHDKLRALDMLGRRFKLFGDEGGDPDSDRMSKAAALRKALKDILVVDGA